MFAFSYCGVKLLGHKVLLVHLVRKKFTALCHCETVICYLAKKQNAFSMCASCLKYTDNLDNLGCLIL